MAKRRRQVSIYINGREIGNNLKSIRSEARKVSSELNRMEVGSAEYNAKVKELRRLKGIISDHSKEVRGIDKSYNKASAGLSKFVGIAAGAFAVEKIVQYGSELFRLGAEMEVLGAKAETVFAEALPRVTQAAEANAAAMGLTISQYTDAATAIGDLLVPMGFTRDEAANVSVELTNLSGALSEWSGGQVEAAQVSEILGKAILGEREGLKQLGIGIKDTDVTARLAAKGLSNLTGASLEQAKAAATLELITENSVDAQEAFTAGGGTLLRRQNELRATFESIREELATALVPVFTRLLEVAQPLVARFAEFITRVTSGSEASKKYSKTLQVLGTAFGNLGKFVRIILGTFQALGNFLLDNFGPVIEFIVVQMAKVGNVAADLYNGVAEFLGLDFRFQEINVDDVKAAFDEIRQARKDSGVDKPIDINPPAAPPPSGNRPTLSTTPTPGGSSGSGSGQESKLQKEFDRLLTLTQKFAERQRLARLSEQERTEAEIIAKYEAQIQKANELERQGLEQAAETAKQLEMLKQEELQTIRDEAANKELDRLAEAGIRQLEEEIAQIEAREAAKQEIKQALFEANATDQELELQELENYFERLTMMAQEYGLEVTAITEEYQQRKAEINDRYRQQDIQKEGEARQEQLNNVAKGFGALSSAVSSFQQVAEAAGAKGTKAAKAFAVVNIAAKTAQAIASGVASAAAQPFPANLAAIATTVATVLGNIAQAKKILSDAPAVTQRKDGGYLNVKGGQDGVKYRARYIGEQQASGMLPNSPVVLASERGAEYFVSNRDLNNPFVFDHVQAIDNIVNARGGIPQFAEGGATAPLPQRPSNQSVMNDAAVLAALKEISMKLDNRTTAVIEDDTVVGINKRFSKLNRLSGGAL